DQPEQTEKSGPGCAGDQSRAGQQPDVVQHVRRQTDKGAEGTQNSVPGSPQPTSRRGNCRVPLLECATVRIFAVVLMIGAPAAAAARNRRATEAGPIAAARPGGPPGAHTRRGSLPHTP